MNYVIYLDVFFIINLLMDFLILMIVRRMVHSKTGWFRCLAGAIIGAVYICILIVLPFGNSIIFKLISYFVISFFMVRISYNLKGFRKNLKPYLLLFVTTFLLGGILNALYFYTEFGSLLKYVMSGDVFGDISLLAFIAFAGISFGLLKGIVYIINRFREKSEVLYDVILEYDGKIFTVKALLDTGNSLIEPISKKPVNVIEYSVLEEKLNGFSIDEKNFRMIPFHSVGKESGLIPGMYVDQMTIEKDKEKIVVIKPMVGIYSSKLSARKEYQMLLHPKLLNS